MKFLIAIAIFCVMGAAIASDPTSSSGSSDGGPRGGGGIRNAGGCNQDMIQKALSNPDCRSTLRPCTGSQTPSPTNTTTIPCCPLCFLSSTTPVVGGSNPNGCSESDIQSAMQDSACRPSEPCSGTTTAWSTASNTSTPKCCPKCFPRPNNATCDAAKLAACAQAQSSLPVCKDDDRPVFQEASCCFSCKPNNLPPACQAVRHDTRVEDYEKLPVCAADKRPAFNSTTCQFDCKVKPPQDNKCDFPDVRNGIKNGSLPICSTSVQRVCANCTCSCYFPLCDGPTVQACLATAPECAAGEVPTIAGCCPSCVPPKPQCTPTCDTGFACVWKWDKTAATGNGRVATCINVTRAKWRFKAKKEFCTDPARVIRFHQMLINYCQKGAGNATAYCSSDVMQALQTYTLLNITCNNGGDSVEVSKSSDVSAPMRRRRSDSGSSDAVGVIVTSAVNDPDANDGSVSEEAPTSAGASLRAGIAVLLIVALALL